MWEFAMISKISIGIVLALLLVGCSNLPPLPPPTATSVSYPEVSDNDFKPTKEVYALGPEDVLRVTVYEHEDLTRDVTVGPDGAIAFPLIGKVRTSGLTVEQVEKNMKDALGKDFLVDPQLSIAVTQYRNRQVYVLGAVKTPGVYPLKHNATLLEIISEAGGLTPEAGWMVRLVRATEGTNTSTPNPEQVAQRPGVSVDMEKLFAGQIQQPIQVYNGDTIHVPPGDFIFVSGEVTKPGRYALKREDTVDKIVILAGGFTKFAAKKQIRVRRVINGQPKEFRAQLYDHLQNEDILIVPESVL